MTRILCVLSHGLIAVCGLGLVSSGYAEDCVCTKPGSPTAEELRAKAGAQSARDRALMEKAQAEAHRVQGEAGSVELPSWADASTELDSVGATPGGYRVIVSFDAAGSAPSSAISEKLDQLVVELERRSGRPIKRRSLATRNGGLSVCLPLVELDAAQQQSFVSELRTSLIPLGRVSIDEHARCGREVRPTGQAKR